MGQNKNETAVDLLLEQHQQVRKLFTELKGAKGKKREEQFEMLVRLLAVHETAEEEVIWPTVRTAVSGGDALADARIKEEGKAKQALADLEKLGPKGKGFADELKKFKQLVEDHADHEEREVFPKLRQSVDEGQLQSMAAAIKVAEAMAPTHPHPHGPNSAVGNMVVGPAVAIMDRTRDLIRDALRK